MFQVQATVKGKIILENNKLYDEIKVKDFDDLDQNKSTRLENQYKRQCLPDLIDPIYVARMVLFLASDDASMCTANNYMVEAGSI